MPTSNIDPAEDFMVHFLSLDTSFKGPHMDSEIFLALQPEILMTEIPALPTAVAGATIVLLSNVLSCGLSRVPPLLKYLNNHIYKPIENKPGGKPGEYYCKD